MDARLTFPIVNAALNALSACFIVTGIILIRRGARAAHKRAMVAAFISSTVFLCSYLYYHLAVTHGQPTRFKGEGAARIAYFAILISHTLLAAVVVPFVLMTLARGLRGKYEKHRAIARYTYPVWLYVSVTGVLIYVMLYH